MVAPGNRVDRPPRADFHSTVLVTGGTGVMGTVVADYLLAEGHSVRVYSRQASQAHVSPGIEPFDGDIRDVDALAAALSGVDAVVHLVGILREAGPTQTFGGVFLEGTRAVIQAVRHAGVRQFIHVTGIGADPDSPYAFERSRGLAERETRESGLDWVILRPSVIFGVRDSMFDLVARSLKSTWPFAVVPRQDGLYQPIWRDDAALCVAATLRDGTLLGGTYELGGPDTWTYRELVGLALRQLKLRRIVLPLPSPLLLAGAGFPRLVGKRAMVTSSELRQLTHDNRTDPAVVREVFGIEPTSLSSKAEEAFAL